MGSAWIAQPLKVCFDLASPVIPASQIGVHLDGLIAYAAVQEALAEHPERFTGDDSVFAEIIDALHGDTLARDASGVYQASLLEFDRQGSDAIVGMVRRTEDYGMAMAMDNFAPLNPYPKQEGVTHPNDGRRLPKNECAPMIAKELAVGFVGYKEAKINLASGKYRNHQFFLPTFQASRATAYCLGDPERIQFLLSRHVGQIGRRGAAGYGAVSKITVEIDEAAREGWKRRALLAEQEDYAPVVGRAYPPYWQTGKQVIWVPV